MIIKKIIVGLVLPLLLASCGGVSDTPPTTPPATPPTTPPATPPTTPPATPAALTLSFTPVKGFHFTWTDVSDSTHYKLKEAKTVGSGYTIVDDNIASTGAANSFDHIVPLYGRLNSKYILESCNVQGCIASDEVFTSTKVSEMASSIGYIKASNTGVNDTFGHYSVALSADGYTLAVGAIAEDSNATGTGGDQTDNSVVNSGAVYVFTRSGKTWTQQAYLKASDTVSNASAELFGSSLSFSDDGNTLAVGAGNENSNATGIGGDDSDNSALSSGAVYVFTRSGTTWTQQAYVKASNSEADDWFGGGLSLSGDGNTLAVSASGEDSNATGIGGNQSDNSASRSGAVYVFTRSGTTWTQQDYLKASNAEVSDYFSRVSLSADGNKLAVGASGEDSNATGIGGDQTDNSASSSGAVYVFTRSGTTWTQQAYVKASNSEANDGFGGWLSLSVDGNTLAVSASGEDSNATGIGGDQTDNSASSSGAVYVFTHSGTTWTQQAYLKASNSEAGDYFSRVSLSVDGNTLAVGAYDEHSNATGINGNQSDNSASRSGAVYVFTRSGSTWTQQAYVKASNTDASDNFGVDVSLSGDGNTLAVSAIAEDSDATGIGGDQSDNSASNSGAVYIY
jgi:hypothetical protein